MTRKLVWLSLDPVRNKIDFYPKVFAEQIERSFAEWSASSEDSVGECELGLDYYNATLHFHPRGMIYQTTPSVCLGRVGFKPAGYRSVKRCVLDDLSEKIELHSRRVGGEWRFCEAFEAEKTYQENTPANYALSFYDDAPPSSTPSCVAWTGDDLLSEAWDLAVVVWEWCRGVPERDGQLLSLPEDWWCPYLEGPNSQIEEAFQADQPCVEVDIVGRYYEVKFIPDSPFGLQSREGKERTVRRVVRTLQELKTALSALSRHTTASVWDIKEVDATDAVPHQFLCPIFQDVMLDPVKTADGHVYDRAAIETWFTDHDTSPLTGLPLMDKTLAPHEALKEKIDDFMESLRMQQLSDGVTSTTLS